MLESCIDHIMSNAFLAVDAVDTTVGYSPLCTTYSLFSELQDASYR